MPLGPLLPDPDLREALALRDQAREMSAHLGQFSGGLFQSADGWMYAVKDTLPEAIIDTEPFPLLTSRGEVDAQPGDAEQTLREAASQAASLSSAQADWPLVTLQVPRLGVNATYEPATRTVCRGRPLFVSPIHPLQIIHMGGRRWHVASGRIGSQVIPATTLSGTSGFISLRFDAPPFLESANVPDREAQFVRHVFTRAHPENTVITAEEGMDSEGHQTFSYTAGIYHAVIGHVSLLPSGPRVWQLVRPSGQTAALSYGLSSYWPWIPQ